MIKPYEPQEALDARIYLLNYVHSTINPFHDITIQLTQRELRLIHKHINNRNDKLSTKIKEFIDAVDAKEKKYTDWNRRVPKTSVIRQR